MPIKILKKITLLPLTTKLFFVFLSVYTLAFIYNKLYHGNEMTSFIQFFGGIVLIFISGISVTIILQCLCKRTFDIWEFLSLSFLGSLLLFPFLIEVESFVFNHVYDWYPLANVLLAFSIAGLLLIFNKSVLPPGISKKSFALSHPMVIAFSSYIFFISIIVSSYPALPDLDPYKWLFNYSYQFSDQHLGLLERPSFGAITFIGSRLAGTDIFTFFKYVLPFFLASITLPAWLVARNFENKTKRWLFLLLTFTSPVVLLYGTTAMPQTPFIILSYFFMLFLLYNAITKDSFFLYSAGILIFLAYLYHPAAIILFALWAVVMIVAKWHVIFSNKTVTFLIFLLILSNAAYFKGALDFLFNWTNIIFEKLLQPNLFNFQFPVVYRNIDRNMMGWPGFDGVVKFYAFHMGPVVGAIILLFTILLFQKAFRVFVWDAFSRTPSTIIATATFGVFFTIAEILPRFPNIALLPDRAWIFVGIFSLVPAFFILNFKKQLPRFSFTLSIFFILTGVAGALYVNDLKQYLITPAQWRSAHWIIGHLPQERLLLSASSKNLLSVHARSRLITIPQSAYCDDLGGFEKITNTMLPEKVDETSQKKLFYTVGNIIEGHVQAYRKELDRSSSPEKNLTLFHELTSGLNKEFNTSASLLKPSSGPSVLPPPQDMNFDITGSVLVEKAFSRSQFEYVYNPEDQLYVYYSKLHEKNPYKNRPYSMSTFGFSDCPNNAPFIFDQRPEKFEQIYNDHNEVIIWKVL